MKKKENYISIYLNFLQNPWIQNYIGTYFASKFEVSLIFPKHISLFPFLKSEDKFKAVLTKTKSTKSFFLFWLSGLNCKDVCARTVIWLPCFLWRDWYSNSRSFGTRQNLYYCLRPLGHHLFPEDKRVTLSNWVTPPSTDNSAEQEIFPVEVEATQV